MWSSTVCGVPRRSLSSTMVCSVSSLSITFKCDRLGISAGESVNVRRNLADSTSSSRRTPRPTLASLSTPRKANGLATPRSFRLTFQSRFGNSGAVASPAAAARVIGVVFANVLAVTFAMCVFVPLVRSRAEDSLTGGVVWACAANKGGYASPSAINAVSSGPVGENF